MAAKGQVDEAAGEVLRFRDQHGPQSLTQLRKEINGSSELLDFAIGWLAHEDTLAIHPEEKSFRLE
jgi:Winged helix-turn-helix domain (DUF2582)